MFGTVFRKSERGIVHLNRTEKQEFVEECLDVVLIDQNTFTELSGRDPHTISFLIILMAVNGGGGKVLGCCAGLSRFCCNDRFNVGGCFYCLHCEMVFPDVSHCDS
jgi:hypothetical protein